MEDDDFEFIPAGSSIEVTFDVAELHDLSPGGAYSIHTTGALSYAEADSNELTGSVFYDSNTLDLDVDGDEASATRIEFHAKRARVQSGCTGNRLTASQTALASINTLALQLREADVPEGRRRGIVSRASTATV